MSEDRDKRLAEIRLMAERTLPKEADTRWLLDQIDILISSNELAAKSIATHKKSIATLENRDKIGVDQQRVTLARVVLLENAIRFHRSQKADDRCIEDDDALYEALGDGIKCDRRVGDKDAMLRNCARYIERRCEGGAWPSYSQIEKRLENCMILLHQIGIETANHNQLDASTILTLSAVLDGKL